MSKAMTTERASPTPRTDALMDWNIQPPHDTQERYEQMYDHARTLERELSQARAAALEEAAKVCDKRAKEFCDERWIEEADALIVTAEAIRALATKGE